MQWLINGDNFMIGQKTLFSSNSDEWETPQDFFDKLNNEFNFSVDLACTPENKKCRIGVFAIEVLAGWRLLGHENCFYWCNPPYSNIKKFLEFRKKHNINAVFLVPSRTDTKWFHEFIYKQPNVEIRFIKGRLKFSGAKFNAPFPSMIAIFKRINNV
jgi:site-specific DNA-methyltransferase (adenine-specific)